MLHVTVVSSAIKMYVQISHIIVNDLMTTAVTDNGFRMQCASQRDDSRVGNVECRISPEERSDGCVVAPLSRCCLRDANRKTKRKG